MACLFPWKQTRSGGFKGACPIAGTFCSQKGEPAPPFDKSKGNAYNHTMGPSMNLESHQAGDLAGINGHNLRQSGHTSASIDPALSSKNRWLDETMISNEFDDDLNIVRSVTWSPPDRQPDTGRKIRPDARVVASFVMTLPEELGHDRLDAWVDASLDWFNSLPGKTAYAVLHMDEPGARPHIHALRIPENDAGNLNYKRDFGGHRERLDELHESYALALEPLGVFMSHEEDRKKRRSARKEPNEPEPEQRRTRRRPRTRPPETPRTELEAENKRLRQVLKDSWIATQKDYQGLKRIKDSDLPEDEKQVKMGEHVLTAIARAEETPAEEDPAATRPATSPATPKRDVATPEPVPGPSFADVIRDWMQHEAAKRQAAEDRAEIADRERKAQEERTKAAEDERKKDRETATGNFKTYVTERDTQYNALVETHNALVERFNKLFDQSKPWRRLVNFFKQIKADDPPKEAETVIKAGLIHLGYVDEPALPEQEQEQEEENVGQGLTR